MATVQQFEDLKTWQEARQLVKDIYATSRRGDFYRDAGLREQIRHACVSTMANIAEGFERGSRKEFIQFLNIARGSNGEARSHLYVALDQGYLVESQFEQLREMAVVLSRRIASFIRYLEKYPANSRVRKPATTGRKPSTFNLQPSTRI